MTTSGALLRTWLITSKCKQPRASWTVLSRPGEKVMQYVDPCYASHAGEFLDGINSHIWIEPTTWMHPQQMGDSFIMDDVANILPVIEKIDLVPIQWVCLFLGLTTCADISNSDSTALYEWALNATENPWQSVMCFLCQERPSAVNIITTWKYVLRLCYSQAASHTLDIPMGPWHKGKTKQVWDTVIDLNTGSVHIWWQQGKVFLYERWSFSQYCYVHIAMHQTFPINSIPTYPIPASSPHEESTQKLHGITNTPDNMLRNST